MSMTTITSKELNQDVSKAKRATLTGPVFITDCGEITHVLFSVEEYYKIIDKKLSIVELIAMSENTDIEFEAPKPDKEFYRPADLL